MIRYGDGEGYTVEEKLASPYMNVLDAISKRFAGSKCLLHQNPLVVNWEYQLTQVKVSK